jgi:hypothetical protein
MNYAEDLLKTRYYCLKELYMKTEEEMALNPNEYSHVALEHLKPKMKDLKDCLKKLEIEVD